MAFIFQELYGLIMPNGLTAGTQTVPFGTSSVHEQKGCCWVCV